jgi:hypothetical protein
MFKCSKEVLHTSTSFYYGCLGINFSQCGEHFGNMTVNSESGTKFKWLYFLDKE